MAKEEDRTGIPVVEAPAMVVSHSVKTESDAVRAIVKDDASISEQALKTQGQRDISDMWEGTQRQIALGVTWVSLTVAALLSIAGFVGVVVYGIENNELVAAGISAFVFLSNVANLVIGFYFGRTNHTKVGGLTRDGS